MTTTVKVPAGISGQKSYYSIEDADLQDVKNELALLALGDFEPLKLQIDINQYRQQIKAFDNDWVDYLPRVGRENDRQGLSFTSMPGGSHTDIPSLGELTHMLHRRVSELEVCEPTELLEGMECLWPLFQMFPKLGRSFVVRANQGGHFVPHRDHPTLKRDTFRLIVFPLNAGPYDYDWLMDDKKMPIEPGRVYYVNTRKMHRTMAWVDNSHHIILNVPMTTENVSKVIANYQHRH